MADELADDPESWPLDPYALLGVGHGIDPRELRKRYNALIRRFKPEQYPEQFRRIREAYEQVKLQEQWRRCMPPPEPAPLPDSRESAAVPELPTPGSSPDGAESWTAPPPQPTFESKLERLWTLAGAGMVDEAYRKLRELEREQPGSRELAIRRYWLVSAFPELEPARDPLEVALRMLADDPGQSPLWAEVRLRGHLAPNWPFEPLFDEMLESARTPLPLTILYDIRWQAALQIGSWRLLLEDVPSARLRLREHPSEWARMLLQVVDKLAWIGEPAAAKAFGELVVEIERAAKGDRAFDFELDRLDFLGELAPQWLRVEPRSQLESMLHDFVAVSWRCHRDSVRAGMIDLCPQLAANVTASMRTLDDWARNCPAVLAQLVRTINEGYHLNRPRPTTPEDLRAVFDEFLSSGLGDTTRSRASLVQFFRAEQILPEDLLHAIDRKTASTAIATALDTIEADWVVRVLARAAVCTAA
ncbi:MAG TPA: J domain-containing protein [Gemmataceae bacterium]|jgi:hypothetical protein|nr:J domain-containing protein [Gemmataceae bacterium]